MTITRREVEPKIRVTYDEMEAFLMLPLPREGEEYTFNEVMAFLEANQVRHGIEIETIKKMLRENIYNKEVCIATGTPMVDGIDGYYVYHFKTHFDKKPKIRPDGTVDYWSINIVEPVEKGQVIAVYKLPIEGSNGMNVKGKLLQAKRARGLPPLKGKGFTKQADGVTYTANIDGKIDMENDRIIVSSVYEIFGNADLSVGNINFVGDVVVHGNVTSGVKIQATGSVTVDGVVEMAEITAGKDIVLRSGMVGGNRALLSTKANLFAKFVEYTKVEVKGDVEVDSFVGCEVNCGAMIKLSGKQSKIIGGETYAVQGVEASILGSPGEVKTAVSVGIREEVVRRVNLIEKKVEVMQDNILKIEEGLKNFEKLEKERGVSYKNDPRRVELLRVKIQDTATMAVDRNELEELREELDRARNASIKVGKSVYPGVVAQVDDLKVKVLEEQERVEFVKSLDKILMMRLENPV